MSSRPTRSAHRATIMLMADKQADDATPEPAQTESSWQFKADDQPAAQAGAKPKQSSLKPVSWTASEFIAHTKNTGWYIMLVIGTVILAAIIFLLTKDKITTVIIGIVGGIFGFMGSRQPRELSYTVSDQGVQIGSKQFQYGTFRSFSVVQEVGIESIWFMPMKRFMPIITIYFEPNDQQKIIDVLSNYLPMENRQMDTFDKLMHQLRF